jgi:hypothetical protein
MIASEVLYSLGALRLLEFTVQMLEGVFWQGCIWGKRGVIFTSRDDAGSNPGDKPF